MLREDGIICYACNNFLLIRKKFAMKNIILIFETVILKNENYENAACEGVARKKLFPGIVCAKENSVHS